MQEVIKYNGISYYKHPKQKYYYSSRKGERYSRSLHRQIWFDNYGEIPEGYQVHHKDHNAYNNTIDNLELVERSEHSKYHGKNRAKEDPVRFITLAEIGREHAKEWHGSEEGKRWHSKHGKERGFGVRDYGFHKCDCCQIEFKKASFRQRFCSNLCKSKHRRLSGGDPIKAICENCRCEFITQKYNKRRFCSAECRPTPNPNGSRGKKNRSSASV